MVGRRAVGSHGVVLALLLLLGRQVIATPPGARGDLPPAHPPISTKGHSKVEQVSASAAGVHSALNNGVFKVSFEAVRAVLEAHPKLVRARHGRTGRTPLHTASEEGSVMTVAYLLSKGADVDAVDAGGSTPLHYAIWRGRLGATLLLLRAGADVNRPTAEGEFPLRHAVRWSSKNHDRIQLTRVLLSFGANPNSRGTGAQAGTALDAVRYQLASRHLATPASGAPARLDDYSRRELAALSQLLQSHSRPAVPTPLFDGVFAYAAGKGHVDVVSGDLKALPELLDGDLCGWTALHVASRKGHAEVVKVLLQAGADTNIRTRCKDEGRRYRAVDLAKTDDVRREFRGNTPTGLVKEALSSGKYQFLKLETENGLVWTAVLNENVPLGATVVVSGTSLMRNFRSKTHLRTFEEIWFGTLTKVTFTGKVVPPKAAVAVARAQVQAIPHGVRVAEVHSRSSDLAGKPVTLRGKVVNFNSQILGTNWLHLQDGSGDRDVGNHNILVIGKLTAKVGDVITVKGTVRTNRDFGYGYSYKVLIEGGEIVAERSKDL